MIQLADSEGPDQTADVQFVKAFAVRICPKTRFRMALPKYCNKTNKYRHSYNDYLDIKRVLRRQKSLEIYPSKVTDQPVLQCSLTRDNAQLLSDG